MLKAKNIMTKEVISVSPATTIKELAEIFIKSNISGAPVINEKGDLIGVVTENDLINKNKRFHIPTVIRLFDAFIMLDKPGNIEKEIKKMAAVTVGEIYTKDVLTVSEDAAVEDVATIMAEKRVHLIPVVDGKKVQGIIGKIDLIKGLAKNGS